MADYYTQYSAEIDKLTDDEIKWLEVQLKDIEAARANDDGLGEDDHDIGQVEPGGPDTLVLRPGVRRPASGRQVRAGLSQAVPSERQLLDGAHVLVQQAPPRRLRRGRHLRYGGETRHHPKDGFVDGLQFIGFPPTCHPSYGASGSCPGGTDSH